MKSLTPPLLSARRGFTLIETMVSVAILSFAMIGVVAFMHQSLKMYYLDRARTMVNSDMRTFTSSLDTDAVTSNFFRIYPNFTTLTTSGGTDASVADGQVGDFVVFVFTDPAQAAQGISMVTRIVGYYREITNTTLNTGPVHRFDTATPGWSPAIPAAGINVTSAPLYTIISTYVTGSASSYPIVTQLAQGLATNTSGTTTTPALFYNWVNRSVMVNAQVYEMLSETGTSTQTGNTYNFTVSPRG